MKIVFFNRFFFPDTSATSQILSDLAFHLAMQGREIHVVTSRQPGASEREETIRGVVVHRVADAPTAPHSLAQRAAAYLHYYRSARAEARALVQRGDIAVLKTDPPLLSSVIGPLARTRGAKVVVWLQDLFPEAAHEYGVPGAGGLTGSLLRRWRDRTLAAADRIVAISDGMARRLGHSDYRIHVIHNWADGKAIAPIDRKENSLRHAWGLADAFVVAYSGNLGRVHEFDTVLDAAARMKAHADIQFVVIGRGPRLHEVQSRAEKQGLPNIRFEPHQSREKLSLSLGVGDVHLSILRPEFEGLVHPSKLYGIMAAGRPTIFVGDVEGETAAILRQAGAGVSVPSGDSAALAAAIIALRNDPSERESIGMRARKSFDERFDMPIALAHWERLLSSLEAFPSDQ
ncbi:MAG: glycosyltransferase family 4 protein [Pseudomonadota bacterium]|nr:glycosyltransferase family 4 protein [Pseudomonadota bacterium]